MKSRVANFAADGSKSFPPARHALVEIAGSSAQLRGHVHGKRCRMKTIPDKAEIALDYPDKLYIGTFERTSKYDVALAGDAVLVRLVRQEGEKRAVDIHLHYDLLASILADIAAQLPGEPPAQPYQRQELRDAAHHLAAALDSLP